VFWCEKIGFVTSAFPPSAAIVSAARQIAWAPSGMSRTLLVRLKGRAPRRTARFQRHRPRECPVIGGWHLVGKTEGVTQLWTVMNTPDGVETPLYVAEMGWSPLPTAGMTTLN
jgi:hypothetical protein